MNLYPHQYEAADRITEYMLEHEHGRLLLVMPPRAGKTRVGAYVAKVMTYDNDLPVLWLAKSRELIDQARHELIAVGVDADQIGMMVSGQQPDPGRLIQLGTYGTVSRRCKPPAELVVSDEAHWDAAAGRRALRALYPKAFHLGLTGTPIRTDNQGLEKDYDDILCVSSPSELIALGRIAEPRIFSVPPELLPDLRTVRTRCGDYDVEALASVTDRPVLVGSIVEEWKRLADGRRTFAYPITKLHSLHIVEQFVAAGVPAAHLDGDTPITERQSLFARVRAGDLRILSSVGCISEGVDAPEVKCGIIARPTLSLALHIQQCFRPLTPFGDETPILLDHAGNMLRPGLGLPHADRRWSLKGLERESRENKHQRPWGERKTERPRVADAKRCPCGRVIEADAISCPECGKAFLPDAAPGELLEVRAAYEVEQKRAEWARIQAFATSIRAHPRFAGRVYRAKFHEAPPR